MPPLLVKAIRAWRREQLSCAVRMSICVGSSIRPKVMHRRRLEVAERRVLSECVPRSMPFLSSSRCHCCVDGGIWDQHGGCHDSDDVIFQLIDIVDAAAEI